MPRNKTKLRLFQNKPFVLIIIASVLVLISIGAAKVVLYKNNKGSTGNHVTFVVKRGPLRISVNESGTIKARDQVILRSEVEGRTSILSLVPEGTRVKQGDLLVELDASLLLDTKIDQEIKVQNDKAAFIGARENLAVVVNQAQSDIDIAKLTLEFAELDLKKYLEGEYPNLRKEAQAKITLAEEELARAEEKLKWSTRLFDEKYISQTELQADQLAASKAKLELELAKNNLTLLENFTYKRNLSQLNSDVKQAEMALERTERKAKADVAQAEADLKAKESEYNRQQDKLQKTEEQIEKAKIYAPADGPAIYATSARRGSWRRSSEPLDVGQEVKERQELIYLPTTSSVKAEVDIHEASLKKVQVGLPAVITVDALPGKTFLGHLAHIAPLPDAQYMWMNPDLKVYNAEIYLDANDSALRTGMSCKAEIIIDQYEDATYIPVQAVLRISGEPTVYVVDDKTIERRKVEIGLDNNIVVRIMSGLAEGEVVLLTPPLKSAALEPSAERVATETGSFENEEIYKTINDRLKENADKQQYKADDGRPGSLDRDSASPRRRQRMGKKFEDMSAEERKKMRERFRNMSPEDREKMRQQREGANK
jgi:HlyD family secretion protein